MNFVGDVIENLNIPTILTGAAAVACAWLAACFCWNFLQDVFYPYRNGSGREEM